MRYSQLAEVYQELEKHPSKLKKTEIVAGLLRKTDTSLLNEVVLLLSGKIYPAWAEEEIGIAGQLMIKAIAKASGQEQEKVVDNFTKSGDLGKTAEYFIGKKKQSSFGKKSLTVEKVFSNLQKIAQQGGKGSQERKQDLIAELLISAHPKEARYIVRTVLEELRIGVAEGIIRDGIAQAFEIEKKIIEGAWFLNQDYGEVAKIAKEYGEKGVKNVKMKLGKPIAVLLAEKSPSLEEAVNKYENVAMEFKYDGMRTAIHKNGNEIMLFTRRLENVTKQFPELVNFCKENITAKKVILDGETVAVKKGKPLPFQRLSQRIKRKYEIEQIAKEIPVQCNLFDIISLEGENLFDKTLEERRRLLKSVVHEKKGKFQLTEQLITKDLKKAEAFYKRALKEGHEGVMVKNLGAVYQPGRRVAGGWLKVKPVMENLDLAIIGGTWGTGRRTGWIGSLILGCRDPETGKFLECGMLGTGIKEKAEEKSDVTFEKLTKMLRPLIEKEKGSNLRIKPKIIIEVAYEEIQKSPTYSSGYALRFPRLKLIRYDKNIRNCDTIERVKKLYAMQKGNK